MAGFKGKFSSAKQDWETPDILFASLNKRYSFSLDVAADEQTAKCPTYFCPSDDALRKEWFGSCWLNPPYGGGQLAVWVRKAFEEAQRPGCTVAMLVPARTNTNWWHTYCMQAKEILFIQGRPKFGGAEHGLPQPLAVVFFDRTHGRPEVYTQVLDDL